MKIFIIGILIAINAYPQFPEYIQEQQNPNRFTRTLIDSGTVNNTTVEFFARNPQLSRGYSWQIELSGSGQSVRARDSLRRSTGPVGRTPSSSSTGRPSSCARCHCSARRG